MKCASTSTWRPSVSFARKDSRPTRHVDGQYYSDLRSFWRYLAWAAGLATISALPLSAAGMRAMMSFTVAQRTREIGIRVALGAHPRRLLLHIFRRVLQQLVLGVCTGSLISAVLTSTADLTVGLATSLLCVVAAIMLMVGLVAALGPARRSLRVHASEALRADA